MNTPAPRATAFEQIAGYVRPAKLPPVRSAIEYEAEFVERSALPPSLSRTIFRKSRIDQFIARIAEDDTFLERLLTEYNSRMAPFRLTSLSAFTLLRDEPPDTDPLDRAARLIVAARDFYVELHDGRLAPDTFRDAPLEMGQYSNLFGTCLDPAGTGSRIFKTADATDIVVASRGQFYLLPLWKSTGPVNGASVLEALRHIDNTTHTDGSLDAPAPGTVSAGNLLRRLTSINALRTNATNRRSLDALCNSLFTVCLDMAAHPEDDEQAGRAIHCEAPENRWYFSSLQLVVCGNGRAGCIFSFPCGIDGNVMMRFSAEVRERAGASSRFEITDAEPILPKPLPWRRPRWLPRTDTSDGPRPSHDESCVFRIPKIGADLLRQVGLRPDPAFNLALLRALKQTTGETPSILEHATMSKFRCMGLAMAPITTPAARTLVNEFDNPNLSDERLIQLYEEAERSHLDTLRAARGSLPFKTISMLYWRAGTRRKRHLAWMLAMLCAGKPDVIVSQPKPHPAVVYLGRPGARLPYVKHLGLHYQIHPTYIELVIMPSTRPTFSNAELVSVIEETLERMIRRKNAAATRC